MSMTHSFCRKEILFLFFFISIGKLIFWINVNLFLFLKLGFQCEILANGRKLGARKRNDSNRNDSKVMLQISDRCIHGDIEMLKMKIIDSMFVYCTSLIKRSIFYSIFFYFRNVNDNLQKSYDRCWNIIKRHVEIFKGWPEG